MALSKTAARGPVLECRDLVFAHPGHTVLEDITFTLDAGELTVILGRNGSGKTSLIHCLNRTWEPRAGRIRILGQNLLEMDPRQIARQVSLVPQVHQEIFPFRVLDVVVMGRAPFLGLAQRPGRSDYDMAARALNRLNAGSLADKNFNRISGGERQMVLLARAMVQAPDLLLLDEPCNHLDINNQYHLLSRIRDLSRNRGISILASMHDPNMAALFADRVIMIKNGRILAQGKTFEVMTEERVSLLYDAPFSGLALTGEKALFFPKHLTTSG